MSRAEGTARVILGAVGSYSTKQVEEIIIGLLADIDQLRTERDQAIDRTSVLGARLRQKRDGYGASSDGDWNAE